MRLATRKARGAVAQPYVLHRDADGPDDGAVLPLPADDASTVVLTIASKGSCYLQPEVSIDGSDWYSVKARELDGEAVVGSLSTAGAYVFDVFGFLLFRAKLISGKGVSAYANASRGASAQPWAMRLDSGDALDALKVEVVSPVAAANVMMLAESTVGDVTTTYVGRAAPDSATSAAVWQILRITEDSSAGTTATAYADGNTNFDNVWDNRASLSYS